MFDFVFCLHQFEVSLLSLITMLMSCVVIGPVCHVTPAVPGYPAIKKTCSAYILILPSG